MPRTGAEEERFLLHGLDPPARSVRRSKLAHGEPTKMRRSVNRRLFLQTTTAASLSTLAIGAAPVEPPGPKRPIVVASGNGLRAVAKAMAMIKQGHDPLGDRPRISPTPALDLFFPTLID